MKRFSSDGSSYPPNKKPKHAPRHEAAGAIAQLPPATTKSADVPSYTPFTVPSGTPPLPQVQSPSLARAPFRHKSTLPSYDRNSTTNDMSYERLEFLGDAYIELIASRLIFERFSHLTSGQQSQLRELLVKNETLAEYSRLYGFDGRVETGSLERMMGDIKDKDKAKGNKGWTKILGDVFEAYVAAVVLDDAAGEGFAVVEKWLTGLWAPKLVEAARDGRGFAQHPRLELVHGKVLDASKVYNPTAKEELQRRILNPKSKLEYEKFQDSVELKGNQLGQNRHFIALYLTGYGYKRKLLGKGEGKNKVEAGNWAATEAMHGDCKGVVDECEEKMKTEREARKAKQAAEQASKGEN